MPQLDPVSFSSQLFWLTFSFVVLYVLLARFFLPRVQSILAYRADTIGSDIEQASKLKTKAQEVRDVYEHKLADTRAKSKGMIEETKAKIAAQAHERQAELDKVIEKKLTTSEANIAKAKKEVMNKLMPVAGEVAERIVEIVVNHKPDSAEVSNVMGKFTKEEAA